MAGSAISRDDVGIELSNSDKDALLSITRTSAASRESVGQIHTHRLFENVTEAENRKLMSESRRNPAYAKMAALSGYSAFSPLCIDVLKRTPPFL